VYVLTRLNAIKNGIFLSFQDKKSAVAHHLAGHVNHIETTKHFLSVNKNKIIVLEVS